MQCSVTPPPTYLHPIPPPLPQPVDLAAPFHYSLLHRPLHFFFKTKYAIVSQTQSFWVLLNQLPCVMFVFYPLIKTKYKFKPVLAT